MGKNHSSLVKGLERSVGQAPLLSRRDGLGARGASYALGSSAGFLRSRISTHFLGNQPSLPSLVLPFHHSPSTSSLGSTSIPVLGSSLPMMATISSSLSASSLGFDGVKGYLA